MFYTFLKSPLIYGWIYSCNYSLLLYNSTFLFWNPFGFLPIFILLISQTTEGDAYVFSLRKKIEGSGLIDSTLLRSVVWYSGPDNHFEDEYDNKDLTFGSILKFLKKVGPVAL